MPCERFRAPDGTLVIACSRGVKKRRAPMCSVCRSIPSTKLCDGPGTRPGKTCDKPLCHNCAKHVHPDTDYCPEHARQLALDLPEPR